jgi:hypothetical protein
MYIEKINSFAEAEVRWNDTKPIRGKEVDMRPLGKRHRKYERIAKIDDNCYALLDGGTGCNSTWSGHYNDSDMGRGAYACAYLMGASRRWHRNR